MATTKYDIKVTATKTGYKVQVKTNKVSMERDIKADFDPVKLLRHKKDFLKFSAGKAKKTTKNVDCDEFEFDNERWLEQLPKWCEAEGFDIDVQKDIEKEIKKIIYIKNL